jgi:hypothetical protein
MATRASTVVLQELRIRKLPVAASFNRKLRGQLSPLAYGMPAFISQLAV